MSKPIRYSDESLEKSRLGPDFLPAAALGEVPVKVTPSLSNESSYLSKNEARRQHIVVAGAGIIGASIAYHLARRGAQVTIVDKAQPASGTSKDSFAWINATYSKQPWHYFRLNYLGIQAWQLLERELNGALQVQWGGSIQWHSDASQARLLREQVPAHQAWGYRTQLVDESDLQQLEPHVQFAPVEAGAICEEEGHVDPVHAVEVLFNAAQQLGAEVKTQCEVMALESRNGQLCAVNTTMGQINADVLVVACGVDTPRVAALAGLTVPLKDSPGLLLHTTPQEALIERVLLAPGAHIKQKLDGRIVTGANFGGSPTTDTSPEHAKRMLAQAARFLPQLNDSHATDPANIDKVSLGWRVLPKDGHPIIGYAGTQPPLYLAAMHSGITLAPLVGRLAATEILDGVEVELLQPYRLARF